MRVIAGTFRGRRLVAPKGHRLVRPTADRVKESVFSILRERVVDANFLDLCAGTGSMGIEALSRGAKHATFLDRDPRCIASIERNLDACGLTTRRDSEIAPTRHRDSEIAPTGESDMRYCLLRCDLRKGIAALQKRAAVFELIYLDPPYGVGLGDRGSRLRNARRIWASTPQDRSYRASLALLEKTALLGSDGTLLVEHAKQAVVPNAVGNLRRNRQTHYGDTVVSFYQRKVK